MIRRAPYGEGLLHIVNSSTILPLLKNRIWNISQDTEAHFGVVLYMFL